jgi:hypothetical protein
MQREDKPMTGMLFVNISENPRAPKLRGFMFDEELTKYQLSVWPVTDEDDNPRRDKHGKRYWSIKVRRDDEGPRKPQPEPTYPDDDDDNTPF